MKEKKKRWLLSEREVAARWGISVAALRAWRLKRVGPRFLRLGRSVRYRLRDLHIWMEARTVVTHPDKTEGSSDRS
jgi:predicted DNA-binding transcriptional regulator AlpA